MAAGDDYQPVPLLDDEKQSKTGSWKTRSSLDAFYQTPPARRISYHWVWIAHIGLLSVSTALFTLSFCLRYARPSSLAVTTQFSTYCKHHPEPKEATRH
jgi:hypothetical protein